MSIKIIIIAISTICMVGSLGVNLATSRVQTTPTISAISDISDIGYTIEDSHRLKKPTAPTIGELEKPASQDILPQYYNEVEKKSQVTATTHSPAPVSTPEEVIDIINNGEDDNINHLRQILASPDWTEALAGEMGCPEYNLECGMPDLDLGSDHNQDQTSYNI
jgi:2,4-dienoyl-CoA reductase-like NADH-dependent reductase (Old Yellow Enzyme family)